MSKPKILIQLDPDPQPSVFDSVVAVDSGVDHLFRHGSVSVADVQALVYGTIFTRGPADLRYTAIFIGGSNVSAAEKLLAEIKRTFFGPMRVSVLFDANGANTTAAAAVLTVEKHADLSKGSALVLGATGPVGQRVVRLLAQQGSAVRVGSRSAAKAQAVCDEIQKRVPESRLQAVACEQPTDVAAALAGVQVVIAAGAAGVELLSGEVRKQAKDLRVLVDLNAVPPTGIAGVKPTDKGIELDGAIVFGAIGVGGLKMKIHKRAIQKLFDSNDHVLDAEEVFAIGKTIGD